ncbi:MAG: phenylacetate--CoA ligase [Micrococcales bacterium]|nr:phenylacetate--CoA ligase [Micrococcales bacterium]
MSAKAVEAWQLDHLKAMVSYVYQRIPFYKQSFDDAGVSPSDIGHLSDLTKLPFTEKQHLRDAYPFGLFAVERDEVVRIHASSGTTGQATVVGYTRNDLTDWGECFGRFLVAAGATAQSVVQVAYGYGLFTGGLGAHQGGEAIGCTVVPISSGNTRRQIQCFKDFGTDILCCTPSYALHIAESAIEQGFDPPKDFRLSAALLGAEPCSEGLRQEIEAKLGLRMHDIYGLSEVMGPGVACECAQQNGLHVCEDHFIVEIVDPETLEPVGDGQWGEAVFTTLTKQCSPLIRYRTHDVTRILPGECACGRTFRRIDRIRGRTDDMLIIRGVNVFPSQIEEVITRFEDITAQYQIVLTSKTPLDQAELWIETVAEFPFDEVRKLEALRKTISGELKSSLQVAVDVKIVEPKTIERFEGKARRIVDRRERK